MDLGVPTGWIIVTKVEFQVNMELFPSVHRVGWSNGEEFKDGRAFDIDDVLCIHIEPHYYLNPKYFQQG